MTPTNIATKGSEVRRRADGLIGEIVAVDQGTDVVTIRWRAGRQFVMHVCSSEQLFQYWDLLRLGPKKSSLKAFLVVVAVVVVLIAWVGNSSSSGTGATSSPTASPTATGTSSDASGQASPSLANPSPTASPSNATDQPAEQASQSPTAAQLSDAQYLDDKYGISGLSHCEVEADDYLRSISKYDYAWDKTGFLESKFDKILTTVKTPGALTLISTKAKLQNGFGAFEHITLYCDYDTQAGKVLGFSAD